MKKQAFAFGWTPIKQKDTKIDNYFLMRNWQEDCFNQLNHSSYWIINAPTASGKSFGISAIVADNLRDNPNMKVIIAVPQTIIASGFRYNCIQFPNGERVEFVPFHDLCRSTPDSNIKYINNFLLGMRDTNSINDRVLICSHASLVMAFKNNPNAFQNITIIIDEAHHAQNATYNLTITDEDIEDQIISNNLGSLITYSLQNPDMNIQIGLSTATFFRGDRRSIIPPQYISIFERFDLPYDEFLKSCQYLRNFKYDFVFYKNQYIDAIKELMTESIGKTIIYIPSVGGRYTIGGKTDDVHAILQAISGVEYPIIINEDKPIMKVKRGENWISVVNLVDETLREEKKQAIIDDHERDISNIDVIITLNMFKEGASWKWADRSIIVGAKNSLNEVIQIIGRLFRDCAGKESVEVYQLLPMGFDVMDEENAKELLNNYLKAVFLSMLLEDILYPVSIKFSQENRDNPYKVGDDTPISTDPMREVFETESEIQQFHQDVMEHFLEVLDEDASVGTDRVRMVASLNEIVAEILTEDGIEQYHKEIARQILRQWTRRTLALQGINVEDVDFDIVDVNPMNFLLSYTSGVFGVDTFRQLRQVLPRFYFLPFNEAKAFAQTLKIKGYNGWVEYVQSGERPYDIPYNPERTYKNKGWTSWGDWLGTGVIATQKRSFIPFEEARLFVQKLGLQSQEEWKIYSKSGRPSGIPGNPMKIYKNNGWISWGDWLGTDRIAVRYKKFRSFEDAKAFVQNLKLKDQKEWRKYCRRGGKPDDIPYSPDYLYKDEGWVSYGDWLGTGSIANQNKSFIPFEEARFFVQKLGFKNQKEWAIYCSSGEKPKNIPSNPHLIYKDQGWINMGDWLGTGYIACRDRFYLPFEKAREFVQTLNLNSRKEWDVYCKSGGKPTNIPADPVHVYKNRGWTTVGDWLGTGRIADKYKEYQPFQNARSFIHSLKLKNNKEWRLYCASGAKPSDIPASPEKTYKHQGWIDWYDWLGKNK